MRKEEEEFSFSDSCSDGVLPPAEIRHLGVGDLE
jgi:hypothetical protein